MNIGDKNELLNSVKEATAEKFKEISNDNNQKLKSEVLEMIDDRNFATKDSIDTLAGKLSELMDKGAINELCEIEKSLLKINEDFKNHSNYMAQFTVKAPTVMGIGTNVTPNPNSYIPMPTIIDGILMATRRENSILNFITQMPTETTNARIVWMEMTNEQGNAEIVEECGLKPLGSFNIAVKEEIAKKIAFRTKYCKEWEWDIPRVVAFIKNWMYIKLMEHLEEQILSGTGGTQLTGITSVASTYTLTSYNGTVVDPNLIDVIIAGVTQIRLANNKSTPTVFVNPVDYGTLLMYKSDKQRENASIYIADGVLKMNGVSIVEYNGIAIGNILIIDPTAVTLHIINKVFFETGLENDDLSQNVKTIIAELRALVTVPEIMYTSILYDSINTIKTAILKP